MIAAPTPRVVRRVLIALDASRQSQLALDAAARLAEWHGAELQGIYVEDINLLRLATFPVARVIGPTSTAPHPLSPLQVAAHMRLGASEAKRRLAETAERRQIRWAFRVERGDVTSVILQAADEADIVTVGRAGTGTSGPGRLGSTARALATRPSRSVFVVQRPLEAGQTIVTVFDGSESCTRSVETAARICDRLEARLVVLVPTDGSSEPSGAATRLAQAADLVRKLNVQASVRPVKTAEGTLARAVKAEGPALCVVACHSPSTADLIHQLTEHLRVSVYLVQ